MLGGLANMSDKILNLTIFKELLRETRFYVKMSILGQGQHLDNFTHWLHADPSSMLYVDLVMSAFNHHTTTARFSLYQAYVAEVPGQLGRSLQRVATRWHGAARIPIAHWSGEKTGQKVHPRNGVLNSSFL